MAQTIKHHIKLLLLLLVGFALTGCANIQYSRVIDADGAVTDRVVVELDLQQISAAGYNINNLIAQIEDDFELLYFGNVTNYLQSVQEDTTLTTTQKTQIANNISTNVATTQDKTKIVATIAFATSQTFEDYYDWVALQSEQEQTNNVQQLDGFLFTTYVQTSTNAFGNLQTGNLASVTTTYLQTLGLEQDFSLSDITLTQLYASPNTSLDSNADLITFENGLKVHMWTLDPIADQTLEFYTYYPNKPMWYLTAIMASVATAIVILIQGQLATKNPYKKQINTTTKNK